MIGGMTGDLLGSALDLFRLPPDRLGSALALLVAIIIAAEYLRITLMVVALRSVLMHLTCGLLTVVLQPVLLAVVLVLSIADHPGRAGINAALVAGLYVVWYFAGQSTLLVRADTQGADLGFISVGALITFGAGLVAVLLT